MRQARNRFWAIILILNVKEISGFNSRSRVPLESEKLKLADQNSSQEANEEKTLQAVWMIPGRSHLGSNFIHNASSSVAALALGLKNIKQRNILPGYNIK